MADNVNVLDVLRKEIEHAGCLGPKASDARAKRLEKVEALIAELIAADVEYDTIRKRLRDLLTRQERDETILSLERAVERRAAALSACTGGSNG